MTTRAEPQGDGSYRITGTKIFITYGEHDMAENIIHLVLARLPNAPAGTRGISLFLVPKFLVNDDGSLGERNDVVCAGIEHKLGIMASPTCVMKFGEKGGAIGYLVGKENRGLATMFVMMNAARLGVGVQGVGVAERATQHATAYAKERRQGKSSAENGSAAMSPIIEHADVRRMLLTMKALTQAARMICFATARELDIGHRAGNEEERKAALNKAALLTPLAKAFSTDIANEVASLGIQVHGGMGFIEETGAAQYLRDARILPIYEGTNGIQAIDLVTRKLPLDGGAVVTAYLGELAEIIANVRASNRTDFGHIPQRLTEAMTGLQSATLWMALMLQSSPGSGARVGDAVSAIDEPDRRRHVSRQRRAGRRGRLASRRDRALFRRKSADRSGGARRVRAKRRRFGSRRCTRRGVCMTGVDVSRAEGAQVLRLARPEKKNALTGAMYSRSL